ncbi:PilN domain-containing protein [Rhodanobacter sp. 115]|uniref:PilN domain-containing protein n=1 Tax=Rhodanobacter sp. FW021-MT20 TaxID=1162282 RepID=UPI000260E37F|nr:PilN domain-containing protein [Rhodanobacter sp. 115]EIL96149.1 fimbrial assembly membrane protein [Rhodanobacter sp. 115]
MAHINLLPWRAERRKQREREFFMQLGAAFVVGILCVLVWSFWMGMRIDNQNERNTYLQGEIKQVDVKIAKINDLEKVRSRLLARKQIIEQLQANRSQMVHLFDELVKTIPTSARLTALKQNGQSMTLNGVAQSNASVADYMRNIEASPWMGQADLSKTENTHDSSRMPYSFGLRVALSRPKQDDANDSKIPPPPVAHTPAERAQIEVFVKKLKDGAAQAKTPADSARLSAMANALENAQTLPKPKPTAPVQPGKKPSISVTPVESDKPATPAHNAAVKGGAK